MGQSVSRLTALKMVKAGRNDEEIEAVTGIPLLEILAMRGETAARPRLISRLLRPKGLAFPKPAADQNHDR